MDKGKFFYFTIKGDGLNVDKLKETIGLPCKTYVKGEKITFEFANKDKVQKTNRWVYTAIDQTDMLVNKFLTTQLGMIDNKMSMLEGYIKDYYAQMELVIYVEDKTNIFNILLNKKIIKLLNRINVEFSIKFIDW